VRIAEAQMNTAAAKTNGASPASNGSSELRSRSDVGAAAVSAEEQRVLDRIGETLARLGRVKRVGLTVKDKAAFVEALKRRRS
jgi:hypothetical protein